MVLQKRLDYGFIGYQVPSIPRASRSARGKRPFRKKAEDSQMYAFDLLATVAGELLLLKESAAPPSNESPGRAQFVTAKDTIKHEYQDEDKPFKHDPCDQGSCDESVSAPKVRSHIRVPDYVLKDNSHAQDGATFPPTSIKLKFETLERDAGSDKSIIERNRDGTINSKCHSDRGSPVFSESCDGKVDEKIERQLEVGQPRIGCMINGTTPDMSISEDPVEIDVKPPTLISSDSSIEVPLCGDHNSSGLFPRCQDDVIVVSRDDDENSSGYTQPSTISLKAFRSPHLRDRRIRKMLASKFWKVAPTLLKDGELSNIDLERKHVFRSRESCYTRQRTRRCSPFKRRKLFERSSISTSDGVISSKGVSNSPGKGSNGEAVGSASRVSSPVAGQESTFKSKDSHVKLNIKSFRVPELFIEIPETATVGSLKRTVVEAVSAILGGGLRIGVLVQGKKVRDDNKTLRQTGISHNDKLDSLGFMLEPNPALAPSLCAADPPHLLLPCDATQPPTRYPVVHTSDPVVPDSSSAPPLVSTGNCIESDHDSVPSPTDMSSERSTPNSRALVAIPTMSVEALAMVPLPRKSRRSELVQRRIRRPFSVSEVEALVQAVEKLGTGRWRDVKLRAFENAKHRTYVDLKDKWKTLVHTARISPQQRRGAPVPQELLDRVLTAHGYWSQQQAKQHVKPQAEPCLLL